MLALLGEHRIFEIVSDSRRRSTKNWERFWLSDDVEESTQVRPRPVNDKGLSFHKVQGDKSPDPAVTAVVSIITHNEKVAFGHSDRPIVGPYEKAEQVFTLTRINAMFVAIRLSVDVNFSANYLDLITGQADDAFDVILAPILWINKYNDIIALGLADGDQGLAFEGDFYTVYEFVDENVVSNQ